MSRLYDADHAHKVAQRELDHEAFRDRVNAAKVRIMERRARARWWHAFFPFTVSIQRREP